MLIEYILINKEIINFIVIMLIIVIKEKLLNIIIISNTLFIVSKSKYIYSLLSYKQLKYFICIIYKKKKKM
jgi:hypothetical protein